MKARKRPIRSPTASTTRTRWSPASGWRTICASRSPTGTPSPGRAATRSAARPSSGPWFGDTMEHAKLKADVAFEMFSLLGAPYFCFHDADVRPEGKNFAESAARLDEIADYFAGKMKKTGVKLLWGTANLFSHRRFMAGAATNPDPDVFAYAAATVKTLHRRHQAAEGRELRAVGRPRGLRDAAQHRPRGASWTRSAASSAWSSTTSTRSASRARS